MGEINIPPAEATVLKSVDMKVLSGLIDQCLVSERHDALRSLRLDGCGLYVANKAREFGCSLDEYRNSKAPSKRARTGDSARRAGDNLKYAVQQMIDRLQIEEAEGQMFRVDDQIIPPYSLDEHITVRVRFQWRGSIEGGWEYGGIDFLHSAVSRPDYTRLEPKRKKTAAQKSRERQDELYGVWEHLKGLALTSVRDFFRAGGNGADIPKTFQVKADAYGGGLNNFSADFWQRRNSSAAG